MSTWAAVVPLAAKSGEAAKSGPIGLAVIILLCVACYFLFKSMSKHLRKVRDTFPDDGAAGPQRGSVSERAGRAEAAEAADRADEPRRGES
jgi:hypothetical protein